MRSRELWIWPAGILWFSSWFGLYWFCSKIPLILVIYFICHSYWESQQDAPFGHVDLLIHVSNLHSAQKHVQYFVWTWLSSSSSPLVQSRSRLYTVDLRFKSQTIFTLILSSIIRLSKARDQRKAHPNQSSPSLNGLNLGMELDDIDNMMTI